MDVRTFLAIAAVISVAYGIAFIVIPQIVLAIYGIGSDPGTVLGFRYFGLTLLALGLAAWFVRQSRDWLALRGLMIGCAAGGIVGFVVSLWATLAGLMNGVGWSAVVIYGGLLAGYAYFLSRGATAASS